MEEAWTWVWETAARSNKKRPALQRGLVLDPWREVLFNASDDVVGDWV